MMTIWKLIALPIAISRVLRSGQKPQQQYTFVDAPSDWPEREIFYIQPWAVSQIQGRYYLRSLWHDLTWITEAGCDIHIPGGTGIMPIRRAGKIFEVIANRTMMDLFHELDTYDKPLAEVKIIKGSFDNA